MAVNIFFPSRGCHKHWKHVINIHKKKFSFFLFSIFSLWKFILGSSKSSFPIYFGHIDFFDAQLTQALDLSANLQQEKLFQIVAPSDVELKRKEAEIFNNIMETYSSSSVQATLFTSASIKEENKWLQSRTLVYCQIFTGIHFYYNHVPTTPASHKMKPVWTVGGRQREEKAARKSSEKK